ncbi:hypothetical protein K1719_032076 [Acacia pycnantha]|nr:hypothetical protein K1719_032076 [Acacia pycnantha]
MGKSSTSHKKKRSKKSLKVRVSGKSKSRKNRSKKLRDSVILESSLSSSSEDSYRSRRARSSKRKDDKGRRKMAKRRSYRHESSDDSCRDRKRKRAKRKKIEQEVREKPYKKKKLRKDESVSSMSNGSLSCSTCYGESASSGDNKPERHRGRVERKGNEKEKRLDRGRSESERSNRYRARSRSSCSFSSESSDERTEEKYVSKNNSRRLKSVITVTEVVEEARELCPKETKEEIVDDHDYPCRSNDSNDGGSKRESDHHSLPSKEKLGIEETEVDRIADSNLTEPERDQRYNNNNNNSQFDRSELDVYGAGTGESLEKKTSETSGASLDGEDLEAILRKRALENLRKFRGEVPSSAKASSQKIRIDTEAIQPPIKSHEPVQSKSIVNNAGKAENFDKITNTEGINLATVRIKSVASSSENEKDVNGVKGESVLLKHHSSCAPEKVTDTENHSETVTDNAIDRHGSDPVHSGNDNVKNIRELSSKGQDEVKDHCQFELKRTSDLDKLHHTKSPPTGGIEDQNAAAKTHDATQSASTSGKDVDKPCVSVIGKPSSESSPVESSSNNLQGEASQGSQFEQKTMSVMRGGEMVQVSYKVYIPKKTPALARRKLKR